MFNNSYYNNQSPQKTLVPISEILCRPTMKLTCSYDEHNCLLGCTAV
jgi:hypothetical protein